MTPTNTAAVTTAVPFVALFRRCPCVVGLAILLAGLRVTGLAAESLGETMLSQLEHVRVREFAFTGHTIFSTKELSRAVAPFTGRDINSEELEAARHAVTQLYVQHGYVNSGAIIPDQPVRDGIVVIHIIEGHLTTISVSSNRWLRTTYIRDRLAVAGGEPLNLPRLRDGLQILRQNPNVEQVNADLRPGVLPGESALSVQVRDRQPFWTTLQLDNYRPASVGAGELRMLAGARSLTGHSDPIEINYGIAHGDDHSVEWSGTDNFGGSYALPVTPWDTTVAVYGNKDDYAIIQEPFDSLDTTSESWRVGVSVRQPVYRTANRELALTLSFDRRESQTYLLGQPFTLSPGAVNGAEKMSVIRFAQEWVDRGPNHVLALRSTFSLGVDAMGVTDDGTDRDATCWVWLGQCQYVRRLGSTPAQVIVRTDVQWTTDPLLSLEQFALGGNATVRGYQENQIVRDRGVYSGVELRVPVLLNKNGAPIVQLAPFFDFGASWFVGVSTPSPTSISSAGLGVLFTPGKYVQAQLYWGYAFYDFHQSGDLQDAGIQFKVSVSAF